MYSCTLLNQWIKSSDSSEVVFEIKAGDEGLISLDIISPSGKSIGNFSAPEASDMGIRQFKFESPEPSDVDALKDAYPAGIYTITAMSTTGDEFRSEVVLTHELPELTSFVNPQADAEDVDYINLIIKWAPVENVDGYFMELDQEDSGINLQVTLPGSVNMFAVPPELLKPDTEYVLGIGTISEDGNISVIETSFSTKK